jgi:GT2 family glycosyltransferase
VTLNNDTEPAREWLAELVMAVESDATVGMVASQVLLAHAPDVIDSAGIEVDWTGTAWQRRRGEAADKDGALEEVFGPCAGAALYRRAMLDEIGLFDKDFFAYYEDVDLAWRARNAGWRCLYAPTARVRHVHSATLGAGSRRKTYLIARNRWWTIVKSYPGPSVWLAMPLIMGWDLLSFGWAVLRGNGQSALRGRWDALREIRAMMRERAKVQRKRRAGLLVWQMLTPPRLHRSI